ncbi:hypothetical protein [Hymenobacter saemangeumensis]
MTTKNNHSLESFVERHRADFDVHEPRPDLWAALEQQLDAPASVSTPPVLLASAAEVAPEVSRRAERGTWLQRYGVAAALAALVFAAGVSEAWKTKQATPEIAAAETESTGRITTGEDAALYLGGAPQALTAAARSDSNSIQLSAAVRGMEAYYASQLARRQEELSQLGGPAAAGMADDYQRELASLDSSYRQLKIELPSHPRPEAVLMAMNRNLQIRLDILDQQLHLGATRDSDPAPTSAFVLADSRRQP